MKKVVIAMSGGVDSSVAAHLLLEAGYDVIGVTLQIWQSDAEDAQAVARTLGIPHHVFDFRNVFREKVIDYFAAEYAAGRTPNPCIVCNRHVKWQALLERAADFGADFIATGHYAKIAPHPQTGRLTIFASESYKDQSYALYNLTQSQIARTLFPIGDLTKERVRALAGEKIGVNMASRPDSQEICFIPDKDYASFLVDYFGQEPAPGDFTDEQGRVIGRHKGISRYTIGQRKGLGAFGEPMFVKRIKAEENQVVLSRGDALFQREMTVRDVNFMAFESVKSPMKCLGKIRYSHRPAPCTIFCENDVLHCTFDQPQRAVTPGQSAVFYSGGGVVCGGVIEVGGQKSEVR